MKYILARHNRIVRQYARGGYCVTDRGNKTLYKCATIAEAEAYIDANPEGMSISHGSWQEELWTMLKAGKTVTPMQYGTAANYDNARSYLSSWEGMCKRMKVAGCELEQVTEGSYRLVRNSAAN